MREKFHNKQVQFHLNSLPRNPNGQQHPKNNNKMGKKKQMENEIHQCMGQIPGKDRDEEHDTSPVTKDCRMPSP